MADWSDEHRSNDRVWLALVRHGQTAWNAERRFLGRTDVPLDALGMAQVEALGRSCPVRFSRVYTSPLVRARDTARRLHADPVVVEALAEMAQGELEGKGRDELHAHYADFLARWLVDSVETAPPGGETLAAARDRALPALLDIARAHRPGEVVAAVSHQMVIASVSCTVAGDPLHNWRDHGVPNAAITWLSWDGERLAVRERGYRTPEVLAVTG